MDGSLIRVVPAPKEAPYRCFLCPATAGPLLDTNVTLEAIGRGYLFERVYVCKTCARMITRTFGFSKGKNLEQIENAIEQLAGKDKEIAERDEMFHEVIEQLKTKDLIIKSQDDQIETLKGKVTQLEHVARHVKETAQELLA